MEEIFSVAKEITNPYSLTALFFLIIFLLYKAVIAKVGEQTGEAGFRLLKKLMTLIAIIAVITLLSTFSLKAYEVYKGSDDPKKSDTIIEQNDTIIEGLNTVNTLIDSSASTTINTLSNTIENSRDSINTSINDLAKSKLIVEYDLMKYEDARLLIGNTGAQIILMKNFTIHWDYRECPFYDEPTVGMYIVEYRYHVAITQSKGSKLLDDKDFKYGAGDIDKFNVEIDYPGGYGIYDVWFTFDYKDFGSSAWMEYKTAIETREICER